MAALLDVNALIALVDSEHVGHIAMRRWFAEHAVEGWATCPLTENGLVRVLSQPSYPSGRRAPSEMIALLGQLKSHATHRFWTDDISLADATIFRAEFIAGATQVTDAYLLGLAARHEARLVSFDRRLPWQAIVGGTPSLLHAPT